MAPIPSGTVTFLFTDIEGDRWRRRRPVRGLVVSEQADPQMHDQLLRLAASYGRRIDWREYRLELVLRPVEILSSGPQEVYS